MSKQVEERVVSMQFDNQHFEKNVQQSMSTLDKLKQKLRLDGAAKAAKSEFESYQSGMFRMTDAINKMWSTLEYEVAHKLKNLFKGFTVDPIKQGMNEYELKMNSVQTIMASTGEELATVNKYLDELNKYSDQTIYSFSDMTQNIGKFTNAGVKLEDAVMAIKGISNEAAVSGANANEASRAMYNFSQALSAGYVKLIDWKSIENANMATVEFKEQLIKSAVAAGTLKEAGDGLYKTLKGNTISATKNFNETLNDQWMTSEVLIDTLKDYADENTEIGKKAKAAAQDIKTFSMMMDTLKESAQSGWAKTWEIIFGDLEEAKKLWTGLANVLGGFLNWFNDARNNFLTGVLDFGTPWQEISKKLNDAGFGKIEKITTKITDATKKLEHFQDIVSKVWHGDYGIVDTGRFELLEKAGYNPQLVQELVNLGIDHKLTTEDVTAAYKKLGLEVPEAVDATKDLYIAFENLTDEQLKEAGLTKDEIKMYRDLNEEAKRLGISMEELSKQMSGDETNGRALLLKGLANIGKTIIGIFKAMKNAWVEIFPPPSVARIYTLIKSFEEFTSKMILSEEKADKLKRTFKGVFALLDIVATLIMGPIKIAFKILKEVLAYFDLDILDLTSYLGDGIVAIRDWIDSLGIVRKVLDFIVPLIKKCGKAFKDWFDTLKKSDNIPRDILKGLVNGLLKGIKWLWNAAARLGTTIIEALKTVLGIHSPSKEGEWIGSQFIQGIWNGLKAGWEWIKTAFSTVVDWFREKFSGATMDKIVGIGVAVALVWFAKKIADAVGILSSPLSALGDLIEGFSDFIQSFGKLGKNLNKTLRAVRINLYTKAFVDIATGIAILAASIIALTLVDTGKMWSAVAAIVVLGGVLAAIMWLTIKAAETSTVIDGKNVAKSVISFGQVALLMVSIGTALLLASWAIKNIASVNNGMLWQAFGVLSGIIVLMSVVVFIGAMAGPDTNKAAKVISKFGFALLLIAWCLKIIAPMEWGDISKAGVIVAGIWTLMSGLIMMTESAGPYADKAALVIGKFGGALLKLAIAMLIFRTMEWVDIGKAGAIVSGFVALMAVLCSNNDVYDDNTPKMIGKFGTALLKLAICMLIFRSMSWDDIARAGIIVSGFVAFVGALMEFANGTTISKGTNKFISQIGWMFMGLAIAMKILSTISWEKLGPAVVGMGLLTAFVAGLIAVTKIAGTDIDKTAKFISKLGFCILLMSAAMFLLSLLDYDDVIRAGLALTIVAASMAIIIQQAGKLEGGDKTLWVMMGCILALGVVMVALSLLDPTSLITASVSLVSVLVVFGKLIEATNYINTGKKTFLRTIITLGVLALVVGALAATIFIVGQLDPLNALASAGALSVLLLALMGAMTILNKMGKFTKNIFLGIGALAALAVAINLIALALLTCKDLDPAQSLQMAITLSGVVAVLSAIAIGVGALGKFTKDIILGSVAVGLLSAVVYAIAAILVYCKELDPAQSLEVIKLLGLAIAGFIVVAAACAAFSTIGVPAIIGAALLVAVFAILAVGIVGTIWAISFMLPAIADNLSKFTENLQPFIDAIASIDGSIMTGITNLAGAIAVLAGAGFLQTGTDIIDTIRGWFGGEDSLTSLLRKLANAVVVFSETVSGKVDVATFEAVANALNALSKFQDLDADKFEKAIEVTKKLDSFATSLAGHDYSGITKLGNATKPIKSFSNINSGALSATITQVDRLFKLATGMAGADFSGMSAFGEALKKVAKDGISKFIKEFENATPEATAAVETFVESTSEGLDTGYDGFKSSGGYLASGFASGIRNGISTAVSAAISLARAALNAARSILRINSPSKEFYEIGAYAGEGMVLAFGDYADKAYDSSAEMAKSAKSGLSDAIARISNVIDSDIDTQPTIRPVMDLSDVEYGANAISDIFNNKQSVGLYARARAIGATVNNRQNGVNNDVIDAINALGRKVGNASGNTYIIDGITYDDGSNITNAVGELVRAARIERRI